MKKRPILYVLTLMISVVILFALTSQAIALNLYSDSLSWATPDGTTMYAGNEWADAGTKISWDINLTDTGTLAGWWYYEYTWITTKKDLSHFLLEVTNDAPANDFSDFSGAPKIEGPKTFAAYNSSDNNMPYNLYGIKFDELTGTNVTLSFYSTHSPTWGDFYAKDGAGGDVYAYNAGFSASGVSDALNDGVHIAVPNGNGTQVPEPMTLLLFGMGLIGLAGFGRRFRKE